MSTTAVKREAHNHPTLQHSSLASIFALLTFLPHDPGGVGGVPAGTSSTLSQSGSSGVVGISKAPLTQLASPHNQSVDGLSDPGSVGGIPLAIRGRGTAGGGPNGVGGIPLCGDPDSAGSIPSISNPGGAGGIPVTAPFAPTAGLILDSTRAPLAGVPVLILSFDGSVIAAATTDELGAFALHLPEVPGLTLVAPTLDLYDVPVVAGNPLLIVVP